jgi:hypothetical protein
VEKAGVFLGKCTNTECQNHTRVFADEPMSRDYNKSKLINVPIEKFFDSAPNAFGTRYHDEVLRLCNFGRTDARETHEVHMNVDASFSVNTRKQHTKPTPAEVRESENDISFAGGDHTRHDTFLVVIKCVGKPRSADDGKDRDREPQRVKETKQEIDLFLSTYRVPQSGPRGTTCAPLKVTTRIGTSEAGPVNVKLWRQVDGGPITSEQKQMHASALGGAKFGDDWSKFEHFGKTTTVQYKAEILGGTFAPSTPWKSITIHCNGDYAPPQSNANPDNSRPPRQPKGEVQLPPTIVTPPPACGTKAAKVRGSAPCIKVAPLPASVPDKRKQWAEQKRKEAAAQKRLAAKEDLRRREAALKSANVRQHDMVRRPMHFGRFAPQGGPQRGVFGAGMIFRGR